jgi:hypothetical protein
MSVFQGVLIILLLNTGLAGDLNHEPEVVLARKYSNSEFFPRQPFTFEYNVYDEDGDYVTVLFQLSFDGGETWFIPRHVGGDVGPGLRSHSVPAAYLDPKVDPEKPEFYALTWNIAAERWWDIDLDNLQWRIIARDYFAPPERYDWVTVPVEHEELNPAIHDEEMFHIMKYEVTNAQYVAFLNAAWEAGQLSVTNDWVGYFVLDETVPREEALCFIDQTVGDGEWESIHWDGERFSIAPEAADHPVLFVTFRGAQAFAAFYGWQLPTREQWYRAALGFQQHNFPWGDFLEYQQANFWNSRDPYDNGPTPVGFYDGRYEDGFQTWDSPSRYGCYDMVGNVREWLRDTTIVGGSWYTINPQDISTQSSTDLFNLYQADYQTGFRCVVEFQGR